MTEKYLPNSNNKPRYPETTMEYFCPACGYQVGYSAPLCEFCGQPLIWLGDEEEE